MKLTELLHGLAYKIIQGSDCDITAVAYDSRKVVNGSLFVCITGFQTDGHAYIDSAIANGAVVLLVEHEIKEVPGVTVVQVENSRIGLAVVSANFYGRPADQLRIIGVTGTNGKTSTTYLLAAVLKKAGKKVGLIGTIENRIGDSVYKTERTTPESLELNELFDKMIQAGVTDVVMEVSSHSLELGRVYGIPFEVAIFTNLTQDHLDFHFTMENYLAAKAKMFLQAKHGVFNADDLWAAKLILQSKDHCTVTTYGIRDEKADFTAVHIQYDSRCTRFHVQADGNEVAFTINTPGSYTVYNGMGVIAAANKLGINLELAAEALQELKGVPGRAQTISNDRGFTIVVDYAHTSDGLSNILKSSRGYCGGRLITVFGCGGDRDKLKRPLMGQVAGELSDFVIITSDNPRTEDPLTIMEGIESGLQSTSCRYVQNPDRREAIYLAIGMARENDVIVIAGKGHENYQILKDKTIHFDDAEVVKEALSTMTK